jgi:single-stranded DNA-specific DHH superfamily exonuclease
MNKNQEEIKNFIINENELTEEEKKVIEPLIDNFLEQSVMDINKWNLEIYKKYIRFHKQQIIKNKRNIEKLDEATNLFLKYIKNNKEIYIITDNDLDGTAANAMGKAVKLFVKRKYKKENLFNVQFAYGLSHGISFQQIDDIFNGEQKDALIITADNGINNREEIIQIKEKYPLLKIIITDHHTANEDDNVFDLVNYVINPEAIELNKRSKITELEIDGQMFSTSISGAHTFALLLINVLEKLKIKNQLLKEEILLIALFSDIGDIINYHLDIHNEIVYNFKNFQQKMYIFQHHIDNLNFFEQVPNKNHIDKMRDYFKESITTFNSVRRLNSLLMSVNNFDKEITMEEWFEENFKLNVNEIMINQDTLKEFIIKTNKRAKEILEYFNEPLQEKYNFYSYIKNVVPYALLSNNTLKTEEDKVYIDEIMDIINDLNQLKKILRLHIVENNLYKTYKKDNIEIYVSGIGSILREILSIQVFIEAKKNIPYLNIAINKEKTEVKGSLRSPSFFPFKYLLLEDERVNKIKKEMELNIKILGHTEAAGIIFTKNDETEITEEYVFDFFDKILPIIDEKMKEVEHLKKEAVIYIDIEKLSKIDTNKFQKILNNYLYIGQHPSFLIPSIKVKTKDLKKLFGNNFKMSTSKKGNKFLNKKINNLAIMYFGEEDRFNNEEEEFIGSFLMKYNAKERKFFIELNLN